VGFEPGDGQSTANTLLLLPPSTSRNKVLSFIKHGVDLSKYESGMYDVTSS